MQSCWFAHLGRMESSEPVCMKCVSHADTMFAKGLYRRKRGGACSATYGNEQACHQSQQWRKLQMSHGNHGRERNAAHDEAEPYSRQLGPEKREPGDPQDIESEMR